MGFSDSNIKIIVFLVSSKQFFAITSNDVVLLSSRLNFLPISFLYLTNLKALWLSENQVLCIMYNLEQLSHREICLIDIRFRECIVAFVA